MNVLIRSAIAPCTSNSAAIEKNLSFSKVMRFLPYLVCSRRVEDADIRAMVLPRSACAYRLALDEID